MVEGSQIDWACHANNEDNTVRQTLLFDEAVRCAIDFAMKDRQTLVVVTADHETGGLSVTDGKYDCSNIKAEWTTKGHSGVPVIVYAFGPKATSFTGVYDNTDLPAKIAKSLEINNFAKVSSN